MMEIFCKCGHEDKWHQNWLPVDGTKFCTNEFYIVSLGVWKVCSCLNFKQDNLKYLEQIYERKYVQTL